MYQVDLQRFEIHQTIQLKINQLLNKSVQQINLQQQQCLQQQLQNKDLVIYRCSQHFQCYQKPYTISKSQKAILIKIRNNQTNLFQIIGILAFGNNSMTLLEINSNDKFNERIVEIQRKQFKLNKGQDLIEVSKTQSISGQIICVSMTNHGKKMLIICKLSGIFEQEISETSSYLSPITYLKKMTSPFSSAPRFYQYCKAIILSVNQNEQSFYLITFKELICQYFYIKVVTNRISGLKCQRIMKKWEIDLQILINKRARVIWHIHTMHQSYGIIKVLAAYDFEDTSRNIISQIIIFQLNLLKGEACITNRWTIPLLCDYHQNQIIHHEEFLYILAHQKDGIMPSMMYKLGQDLKFIRKYQVPRKSRLSQDSFSVLLLTQCETYIVSNDKVNKNDMSMDQMIKRQREEKFQSLQKQSVRQIQKCIDSKDYKKILKMLEQKKQQYQTHKKNNEDKEDGLIGNHQIQCLDDQILRITILIHFLKNDFGSHVKLSQHHEVFLQWKQGQILNLLKQCIYTKIDYFIKIARDVIIPYAKIDPIKLQSINENYYQLFENCINQLKQQVDDGNKNKYEEQIVRLAMLIRKQEISLFQRFLKQGRAQFLKRLFYQFYDPQLFILLYCESKVLSNDSITDYIKYLEQQRQISQSDINSFLKKLISWQLQSIKQGTSARPDIFFIQKIPPSYHQMIYNYLLEKNRNLAWILGLKLKIRDAEQITNIAFSLKHAPTVETMLKVVKDKKYKKDDNFRTQEIMAKICSNLNIDYISITKFINLVQQGRLPTNKKIQLSLWNKLKESTPGIDLQKLQKKIKLQ